MPKIRNIIIFVVIAILLVLGYLFFTKSSSTPPTLVSSAPVGTSTSSATATSGATANSSIAQNFLALLLNVSNIKLDDSIFSDPAFASLHDSTIVLAPDGTQGRLQALPPACRHQRCLYCQQILNYPLQAQQFHNKKLYEFFRRISKKGHNQRRPDR